MWKDKMNSKAGKYIAEQCHQYMEVFLEQFLPNGKERNKKADLFKNQAGFPIYER